MAFPTIPTTGAGRVLTSVDTAVTGARTGPNLSSLTKNAGDLLIAICIGYQSSATAGAVFSAWTSGWTEFADRGGGSNTCIGMAWKISTGSESGTISVTQAPTIVGHACWIVLSIPGGHATTAPEASPIVNGTTAAADPAAFDPAGWAAEDTLWIAVAAVGETATTGSFTGIDINPGPTNYTDGVQTGISGDVVGGIEGAVAFRQLNAASENVGPIASADLSNARNSAVVIAVRPVPVFLDSGTAELKFTPDGTDVFETNTDAGTGVLLISPYGLDIHARTGLTQLAGPRTSAAMPGAGTEFDVDAITEPPRWSVIRKARSTTDFAEPCLHKAINGISAGIRTFLDALVAPQAGTHILRFKCCNPVDGDVAIKNGDDDSLVAGLGLAIDGTWEEGWSDQSLTLTAPQVAAIHNYADLYVDFILTEDSGTQTVDVAIGWIEFEIPQASTGPTEFTDSGTAVLVFTPSAVENAQLVDSDTGFLDLQPSGTEAREITDTGTGFLDLQPSGTDVYTGPSVDAGTGILTFTPSGTEFKVVPLVVAEHRGTFTNPTTEGLGNAQLNVTAQAFSGYGTLRVRVYEGGNTRVTKDFVLSTILETYNVAIPNIANYDNLEYGIEGRNEQGGALNVRVSELYIKVPSVNIDSGTAFLDLQPGGTDVHEQGGGTQFTDSGTATLTFTPSGVEAKEIFDSATAILSYTPNASEQAAYTDANEAVLSYVPSGVEGRESTDTGQSQLTLTPSGSEIQTHEYVDTATGFLDLQPFGDEFKGGNTEDAATGLLAFVPTGSDIVVYVDSDTGILKLTPSGVEIRERTDAATAQLTFSPSSLDVYTPVDSGIGFLDLQPSGTDEFLLPGNQDAGTATLKFTPATVVEIRYLFDVLLVGELSRRWETSELQSRWSGVVTRRWDGTINEIRRFSGLLLTRKWDGVLETRRWVGTVARRWVATYLGRGEL